MSRIEYFVTGGSEIHLSLNSATRALSDLEPTMIEAAGLVYEGTRQWMDSGGEQSWPPLAESTVRKKASQGLAEPSRPLYATGNLYESVTSPHGPRSFLMAGPHSVVFGVDWYDRGHSIPDVLASGAKGTGRGHHTTIPARPIWPPIYSVLGLALMEEIGLLILRHVKPKFPGARIAPGVGGTDITLGAAGQGGAAMTPAFPGALVGRLPAGSPGGSGGQFVSFS